MINITEIYKDTNKIFEINLNYYKNSSVFHKIINSFFNIKTNYDISVVVKTNHPIYKCCEELIINSLFICIDNKITLKHIDNYILQQKNPFLFHLFYFKPFVIPQIKISFVNFYFYD